jgi:protein arginine N-methyltransferase 5
MTERDLSAQKLLDYLQSPLQPYRDNLEAEVYDIFEKDNHKYNEYEIALLEALTEFKE